MIPVNSLAMLLGSLMLLISLACLGGLLVWLMACLHPRSRQYMSARRWRFGLLAAALLLGSLPTIQFVGLQVDDWREQRALGLRFEQEQVVRSQGVTARDRDTLSVPSPLQLRSASTPIRKNTTSSTGARV